ncbi:endonuclease NucS domain-containing protein [Roseimaritima sediminicola]|uniref:endonuclease NucS domain-containing protein n=1 Tax=Roseimaritima sediminicola TaxID=2662066 RepID=UPI0012984E14|nr:endonuclease NucS domain-containing protein [Roseimaritima sediminicola]
MSDIKLFRTVGQTVTQLEGHSVALEKSLQTLIETHLDVFLGIRFIASEYSTGKTHSGRIDTLGIDENGCPCIIEYKRSSNENAINQGLFYLDWLLDHKGEFELLVLKRYGKAVSDSIEWSSPRLLCIAGDFTKYDSHAVQQMNRNIELLRYLRFGEEFLLLELVNAAQATGEVLIATTNTPTKKSKHKYKHITEQLADADPQLLDVFEAVKSFCMSLGDDVQAKTLKFYMAFKRIKNFASVEIRTNARVVLVYVKVDPDTVELVDGFTRDVRQIGHFGTGDLEITLRKSEDLEKALPLLEKSYEVS